MGWRSRLDRRVKPQQHHTKRLLWIVAGTVAGLAVLFVLAYVVARLDVHNPDNQGP